MYRIRTMQKCRLFFILYFIIIATFPYSHRHDGSESYLLCSDIPLYSPKHGVFCVSDVQHGERYTDSHSSHDYRHLHFLAEDSNPTSRPTVSENKAQLKHIAISETVIMQFLKRWVISMTRDHTRSHHDGFNSPYSGLSPPSC